MPSVLGTSAGLPLLLGGRLMQQVFAVAGPPTQITLMDFVTSYAPAHPVVQRKAGQASADVPVLFGFTGGPPASVQARVVKAAGGAVVTDWTTLTELSTAAATGSGKLPGVPQGAGYLLQIRDGASRPLSGSLYSAGSVPWGVGVVFLFAGQSNMVNTFGGDYQAVVPGTSMSELDYYAANIPGVFFDANGWHGQGVNGNSQGPQASSQASTTSGNAQMCVRVLAAALQAKYGYAVPVAIIPWAFGAQDIVAFIDPAVGYGAGGLWSQLFKASGSAAGSYGLTSPRNIYAGDFEGVLYHQGEANSADAMAVYRAKLQALHQTCLDYVQPFGRTAATMLFAPAILGSYGATACPGIENVRTAEATFAAMAAAGTLPGQAAPYAGVQVGWTTIDLRPGADGLHFSDIPGQQRSMRRAMQTILAWLGCAAFSGRGPALAGTCSRSGLVAMLDVAFTGGSVLAAPEAGAVTGWYANTAADFTGSDIPVSVATAEGGTKVAVTFPAGTAFPAYVKHLGGRIGATAVDASGFTASCYPDTTNMLYDNCQYPSGTTGGDLEALGLPLLPSVGSVAVV